MKISTKKNNITDLGLESIIDGLLKAIGEDPKRDGLLRTPQRVAKMLRFLTEGYNKDPKEVVGGATFSLDYDEMIVVKDIDLFSLCEHHLLPFFGKCHIAYIPRKKILGLSKFARIVNVFSRRLQVQERLTSQIANFIKDELDPKGVGTIIEASHLCMMMRGVEKQNAYAITSSMLGIFRKDSKTREEFLDLIKLKNIR